MEHKLCGVEDVKAACSSTRRWNHDHPRKIIWKRRSFLLILVTGVMWVSLILILAFCYGGSGALNRGSQTKQQHRCSISFADDPERIVVPKKRTEERTVINVSYISEDERGSHSVPLFGGHQNWSQREKSFNLSSHMNVHCGFMPNSGVKMASVDINYIKKCKFVVASAIFGAYDIPRQPSYIGMRSKKLFCFLMAVGEKSLNSFRSLVTIREDGDGTQWVGIGV